MNNIENLIIEFFKHTAFVFLIISILALLWLPFFSIIMFQGYKNKDKEEKVDVLACFSFLLFAYILGNAIFWGIYFDFKDTTIKDLNNKYNVVLQEKNNDIEINYVPKDKLKKANFKFTIQQDNEKYYMFDDDNVEKKKEVKKEDLKDFIKNVKKQENYKGTKKIEKITLKDLE